MDVHQEEVDTVEFRTSTIWEQSRQPSDLPQFSADGPGELLRVCGWCKKVVVGETWAELEEAVARLRLFHRPILPSMTHGICERCYESMTKTLADA
jgi:hypothetical protein